MGIVSERPESAGPGPTVAASAQRKYLTILFSDLCGSTRLAGTMEAEDYAALLARLCEVYQDVVERSGGMVVQLSGDGLLAMFGHPELNEDDGRTAVIAALELHDRVRLLSDSVGSPTALRLHSGVHSGLVLLHDGDMVRGRFELHGSATNIASRLADAAQPDEILVSEATLGPDHAMFRTGERRLLMLRGKDKPISAFDVRSYDPPGRRFEGRQQGSQTPFVGRQRELKRLGTALRRAARGQPTLMAVLGAPGVGKTRLLSHLLQRKGAAFRVFRGECDAHPGSEPLQPFLQIIRTVLVPAGQGVGTLVEQLEQALVALGPELDSHSAVLLDLLASGSTGTITPSSVSAAYTALIRRLVADGSLALFIDDWQWADDATRRLLESIRDLTDCPLLVLLTARGDAKGEFDTTECLVLTPFTAGEAEAAVRQLLPKADAFLIDDIGAASGGNPLFVEELCHSAAYGEEDFRTHQGSGWLDILIQSRFARLSDDQADLLAVAAVAGNVFPTWLIEHITGCEAEDPLVRTLADED